MLEVIHKESTACKKVSIVSHSMGATATLIGLARAENAQNYISQVVLMEPCAIANVNNFFEFSVVNFLNVASLLPALGIYSIFGP